MVTFKRILLVLSSVLLIDEINCYLQDSAWRKSMNVPSTRIKFRIPAEALKFGSKKLPQFQQLNDEKPGLISMQGLWNAMINLLPIELHLSGYHYCGPGTKLEERLERSDKGINKLDEACMQHDIAYSSSYNFEDRHKADLVLINMAKQRTESDDASITEKLAAWLVVKLMEIKSKYEVLKKSGFPIRSSLNKVKPKDKTRIMRIRY